jgi:hypothetical protein
MPNGESEPAPSWPALNTMREKAWVHAFIIGKTPDEAAAEANTYAYNWSIRPKRGLVVRCLLSVALRSSISMAMVRPPNARVRGR